MKKFFISALCVVTSLAALADISKISTAGHMFMMQQQLNPSRGNISVNTLVRMAEGYSVADLEGYQVLAAIDDDMAIVELTLSEIELLSESPAIEKISFGEEAFPCMDNARKDTGVDMVHQGVGLESPYTGKGVIAGIFDNGIDPNHINFSDAEGKVSRVKRFYNLTSGRLYTEENMTSAGSDNSTKTHGTHCAGIMGGGFNGAGKIVGTKKVFGKDVLSIVDGTLPYYGVAREADLYLSGGQLTNPNILLACQKIADYAKEQGQPCVINLSLGSVNGPHDGTSDFCIGLDKIAQNGAIIFVAAGNEGATNMSIKKTLSSSDNMIKTFASKISSNVLEFWGNTNGTLTGTFAIYNKTDGSITRIKEVSSNKAQKLTVSGKDYNYEHNSSFDEAFSTTSWVTLETGVGKENNRSYVKFSMTLTAQISNLMPVFLVRGATGQTLLTTCREGVLTDNGIAGFDNGTPDETINDMATGNGVICIGSYNTRLKWPVFGNNSPQNLYYSGYTDDDLNDVSDFSSCGTTLDGKPLPHVCAPGMGVISSYSTLYMEGGSSEASKDAQYICASSSANGRNNYWLCEQGTSMATPFAAGTVALWLQAKPSLTRDEVIDVFNKTATRDAKVLAGNPVKWGAGKINAIEGIKYVITGENSIGSVFDDEDLRLIITNESGNMFNITVGGENGFNVRMYSLSGSLVKTAASAGQQMDLDASDLQSGVYILEIVGETSHFTRKVTVK